jgi:murein DD-endopeptidase MepM/ murein hydrolase activator NlpD
MRIKNQYNEPQILSIVRPVMKIFKPYITSKKLKSHAITKKLEIFSIVLVALIVSGMSFWIFRIYGDFEKPIIVFKNECHAIGQKTPVDITLSDYKSGLRDVEIGIIQNNKTHILLSAHNPTKGLKSKQFFIKIQPSEIKLSDGPAILRISATDYSFHKNKIILNKEIIIDTTPPQLSLSSTSNNINPGGSGVIVYSASETLPLTGIQVEDIFFRGYAINASGKHCYAAYFAVPLNIQNKGANIKIIASDSAGNESSQFVPCLIRHKKFRSDKMNLTENFLQEKMPEFQLKDQKLRDKSLIETFTYVNDQMRSENFQAIQSICMKSEPKQLWQDTFLRMKDAAPMALFGDKRTYFYKGRSVGESVHMGIDLASTANVSIEASNKGIVSFTGPLGIYGNTVIIDHGLGLSTLYAHLNSVNVKAAQTVKKGEVIGQSGMSGLAGGDHLHFSVLIGGQFVNPQEWWDSHWITDNIGKKLSLTIK